MPKGGAAARASVAEERRKAILAMLRQHPGSTIGDLVALLAESHETNHDWPQAPWPQARNEPYDVGVRQHLYTLLSEGVVRWGRDDELWTARWWAPPRYCACGGEKRRPVDECCARCVPERAAALLPADSAPFEEAIRRERRRGVEIVLGVTTDLKRVIRVGTSRGLVELEVSDDETWEQGFERVAASIGVTPAERLPASV